jgi:hypothetical protein
MRERERQYWFCEIESNLGILYSLFSKAKTSRKEGSDIMGGGGGGGGAVNLTILFKEPN